VTRTLENNGSPSESVSLIAESPPGEAFEHQLASGRLLNISSGGSLEHRFEELRIQSRSGDLELHIILTPEGPKLRLSGIRLELASDNDIKVNCRNFEIESRERIALTAKYEIGIQSEQACRINGQKLFFNCDPMFEGETLPADDSVTGESHD